MSVPYYANQPLPDTNARQPAMTIRPSSTALLTIDSEDRIQAYIDYLGVNPVTPSPYNFSIRKTESLMPGFMTRIGVSEISFPWTIPNINLKTNQISFTVYNGSGSNTGTITIPFGFYTPAQLATIMTTKVQAFLTSIVGNTDVFTMTYGSEIQPNPSTIPAFTYRLQTALNSTIQFNPVSYDTATYPYPATTKQLYHLLGYVGTGTPEIIPVGNNSYYTGGFTLVQGFRYVDIVCNQLTNSQAQKDQTSQTVARDMLCRLYINSASGVQSTVQPTDASFCPPGCAPTVLYRNYATPKQIQWIPNQNIPGFLQFQVYDDTGALLDESIILPNPRNVNYASSKSPFAVTDWSMTMLVSEC